jgi:thioredoxin reductase (NADPH)
MHIGIVGAGPAGVAAASYLARCGEAVTIYEKDEVGGLLANAWKVENFPLVEPLDGPALVGKLRRRLEDPLITLRREEVLQVRENAVITSHGERAFDAVFVATGTGPLRLPELEVSRRVVYEYRHLPSGLHCLAVTGSGDAAFDGSIRALEAGCEVHMFARGPAWKAVSRLVPKALDLGLQPHPGQEILKVEAAEELLTLTTSAGCWVADALLICAGRIPALPELDPDGGALVIGDAAHPHTRQASIAIGDGVRAAMELLRSRES